MSLFRISTSKGSAQTLAYCAHRPKETEAEKAAVYFESDIPVRDHEQLEKLWALQRQWHGKEDGIQSYHALISLDPNDAKARTMSNEEVTAMAKEFAEKFAPGHSYGVFIHRDRSHPHAHIIWNSVNQETGKKFHMGPPDLKRAKEYVKELDIQYGLAPIEKKPLAPEKKDWKLQRLLSRSPEIYSWKNDLKERIIEASEKASSMPTFQKRLKELGVTANIKSNNNITYAFTDSEGKERKARVDSLGENYSYGTIEATITERTLRLKAEKLRTKPTIPQRSGDTRSTSPDAPRTSCDDAPGRVRVSQNRDRQSLRETLNRIRPDASDTPRDSSSTPTIARKPRLDDKTDIAEARRHNFSIGEIHRRTRSHDAEAPGDVHKSLGPTNRTSDKDSRKSIRDPKETPRRDADTRGYQPHAHEQSRRDSQENQRDIRAKTFHGPEGSSLSTGQRHEEHTIPSRHNRKDTNEFSEKGVHNIRCNGSSPHPEYRTQPIPDSSHPKRSTDQPNAPTGHAAKSVTLEIMVGNKKHQVPFELPEGQTFTNEDLKVIEQNLIKKLHEISLRRRAYEALKKQEPTPPDKRDTPAPETLKHPAPEKPPLKEKDPRADALEILGKTGYTEITHGSMTRHTGKVIAVTSEYVIQDVGCKKAILHELKNLNSVPQAGQEIQIQYNSGKGKVHEKTKSPEIDIGF